MTTTIATRAFQAFVDAAIAELAEGNPDFDPSDDSPDALQLVYEHLNAHYFMEPELDEVISASLSSFATADLASAFLTLFMTQVTRQLINEDPALEVLSRNRRADEIADRIEAGYLDDGMLEDAVHEAIDEVLG